MPTKAVTTTANAIPNTSFVTLKIEVQSHWNLKLGKHGPFLLSTTHLKLQLHPLQYVNNVLLPYHVNRLSPDSSGKAVMPSPSRMPCSKKPMFLL